jgi:hypothetical protein
MTTPVGRRLMTATGLDEPVEYGLRVVRERAALYAAVDGAIACLADATVTAVIVDPSGAVRTTVSTARSSTSGDAICLPGKLLASLPGSPGCSTNRSATASSRVSLLLDGSHIQAWLPPVAPAPAISIRKKRNQGIDGWSALTLDECALTKSRS